ncbi:MAG: hypothetical protein ABW222_10455 [Actinomycetota bacterium]
MTIPPWLQLLIYALAVARVTGLIVADSITEELRDSALAWLDDRPKTLGSYLATLIQCPWCAGMWVALIASPLVWFYGGSPFMLIPAVALAFSQVTGMTHNLGR